ncbi:MAG: putative inorganic carbon transporter subunit DabA, partial [Pirellulales bacterium]
MTVCRHASEPGDLSALIADAAHVLPAQGPIDVFIHHNTLHAFEGDRFETAVIRAADVFDSEPFLPEIRYREELARERIRVADIDAVLDREDRDVLAAPLAGGRITARDLHRVLLLHPIRQESDAAVRWTLTESDVLEKLRADLPAAVRRRLLADGRSEDDDELAGGSRLPNSEDEAARRATYAKAAHGAHGQERRVCSDLWHSCIEAVATSRPAILHVRPPVRHRDLIRGVDPSLDTDALVHPLLIRLCAAFLDQGVASWPMPDRDRGLWHAVTSLYANRLAPTEPWSGGLPAALAAVRGMPAEKVITAELARLGVPHDDVGEFLRRTLLALRGWAGMIRQFEERPDRAPVSSVPARLVDFLAVRLVLDRVAAEWAAWQRGLPPDRGTGCDLARWRVELQDQYPTRRGPGTLARAFLLHQVSQLVGLTGAELRSLDENEVLRFEHAIAAFDVTTRRRLFHLAYERRHRIMVLDALASHASVAAPPGCSVPPAQVVVCIDERCESFRRHLEELGQGHETFGTAGFFAVPMYYRGLDDWHASPLCPIVMRPSHTVVEVPEEQSVADHHRNVSRRRRYGQFTDSLSAGSRTLLRGGLFTALAGSLAAVPLVARVAFPRLSARIGRSARELARGRIATRLDLFRDASTSPLDDGTLPGFDVSEMAASVRRVLEDIGLTGRFARLVAVLGHGSSSLNNPHESAYDCGACGGGKGGPNARAFALMANDPQVRTALAAAGLEIPADTRFIGGMLDTCSDGITWFDLDRLPESHRADMQRLHEATTTATSRDAHERCRRFESAPLDLTPSQALAHVEARSVDLAQVRPELGHATNAVAVIGRRWRTRGLFLDRRAFLVSYDPQGDAAGDILARTLAAVGPVGAGINLEYFFSTVDRLGYGAGTKLPHNITGLIGVMDGHASDLRTGLPFQGVDIHEPVRLLVVVDATRERIAAVLERLPAVRRMVANRWVQLVAWDPDSGAMAIQD